jgi:hypothetical protein
MDWLRIYSMCQMHRYQEESACHGIFNSLETSCNYMYHLLWSPIVTTCIICFGAQL